MQTFNKIDEYGFAETFRPFQIRMAGGQAIDIRHPDMFLVGKTSIRVYTSTTDDNDRWHEIPLEQIEIVEPL